MLEGQRQTSLRLSRVNDFIDLAQLQTHQPPKRFIVVHNQYFSHPLIPPTGRTGSYSRKIGQVTYQGNRFLPTVEHLANLADKNCVCKWLVQEVSSWIEHAVPSDKAVNVARHIHHLQTRLSRRQLSHQSADIHVRHYDID